jgi:hypothetical protein
MTQQMETAPMKEPTAGISTASICAVLAVVLAGCDTRGPAPYQSKLDPLALQQMQTEEFETSKETLFAATVSVFQDMGFTIQTGEFVSGIITAKSPTITKLSLGYYLSVTVRASAFVESTRPGFSRVRLNFVESRSKDAGLGAGADNDTPFEEPGYYEGVFAKIREGVFVRDSLRTPEGAPAGAPASK